jgi:hypothetical protein
MGRHLWRLASVTAGALAAFALAVPMTAQAAVSPAPSGGGSTGVSASQKAAWQAATADGLALTATVQALAPYVVRAPDGTLSLDAPAAIVNRLPSTYVGRLTLGLGVLNAKVTAGELRTTAAGGVFDPKSDTLMLQGGWSGHGIAWWGQYWCLNHSDVDAMYNGWWWDLTGAGIGSLQP